MHASWRRWFLTASLVFVLSACNSTPKCTGDHEYTQAVDRPRLDLPANVTASERMAPLVIPPADPNPEALDPPPNCLDEPPPYTGSRRTAQPAAPAPGTG